MRSSHDLTVLRGRSAAAVTAYRPGDIVDIAPSSPGSAPERTQVDLGEVFAAELDERRERARREGHEQGYATGMAAAQAELDAVVAQARAQHQASQDAWEQKAALALEALAAAAQRLDERTAPLREEVAHTVAEATMTLVEAIVGRELALAADPGADAIRRVLALQAAEGPVRVGLHPEDFTALSHDLLSTLPDNLTVCADPTVERAGAIAVAGPQRIDAQISAALARVREVIAP